MLAAGGSREDFLRRLPASMVASADMAHATHPNYPERHEPGHLIEVNGGPVLKVHPNLRYATDGRTAAAFALACQQAGVPLQRYEHRADLPCGSTIGPMTSARTGIPTVDVGAAQLAMHSARELMGAARRRRLRGGAAGVPCRRNSGHSSLRYGAQREMVTFDCSDPAKLAGWWADAVRRVRRRSCSPTSSCGDPVGRATARVPEGARSHPRKEPGAPGFQCRRCGWRSVAADSAGATEVGRHNSARTSAGWYWPTPRATCSAWWVSSPSSARSLMSSQGQVATLDCLA